MGTSIVSLALCVALALISIGDARRLCGIEIEYRGFDPVEALKFIQQRQIQEFEQFKAQLEQLKFKLQSEDYFAWQRCLSEYENEKLRFLETSSKIRSNFHSMIAKLLSQKLDAAQYEMELQKLLQQFQTQFTPSVEMFKSNIKNLFETIRDEKRRRKWWSTVKTTQVTTGPDGRTTRTSITKTMSGVGGQQSGSFMKSTKSVSNSVMGGPMSSFSGASAQYSKTKSESSKYENQENNNDGQNDDESNRSGNYGSSSDQSSQSGNYGSSSDRSSQSGNYGSSSDQSSQSGNYGSSSDQSSRSGEYSSKGSSGYDTRGKDGESQSSYGESSTKEVKKESSVSKYIGQKAQTGSFSDNNKINFASTQTRSGIKDTYGGAADTYSSSSGNEKGSYSSTGNKYRRRRTLGLISSALGAKRSALSGGGSYGSEGSYGTSGYGGGSSKSGVGVGASVGVNIGVGVNGGGQGRYNKGSGSSGYQSGSSGLQAERSGMQSGSGGYSSGSGGFGGNQGSSGNYQMGSSGYGSSSGGGFQKSASKYQEEAGYEAQHSSGAGYSSASKYSESSVKTMGGGGSNY